jgi:hypothetical protein
MAEWKCVFDGEIKKRPVVVNSYDRGDEEPAVRVMAVPIGDARAHWGERVDISCRTRGCRLDHP